MDLRNEAKLGPLVHHVGTTREEGTRHICVRKHWSDYHKCRPSKTNPLPSGVSRKPSVHLRRGICARAATVVPILGVDSSFS